MLLKLYLTLFASYLHVPNPASMSLCNPKNVTAPITRPDDALGPSPAQAKLLLDSGLIIKSDAHNMTSFALALSPIP